MIDGVQFRFDVTHKPDALRLDGFSLLCCAPDQWGPGVRTEDRGIPVADIVAAHTGDFAATAARVGTTEAHVRQAVAYSLMRA
jgi:hypothetical protein